ncbi:hypothetical protein FZI85_08300 [Mycobacterium sp. CBMA293]|uniref:hypothetical protein n=1 Tax=unclassified Mycolicibacterium TaxID=2636767 RepID=UPI0012DD5F39|nr:MULTISPECIES: hypothetical protein [unclassified Mycolicibacterium]MUL46401.1 hypothetical protein [Mycolicibacterium sp. CBMA 360]MUL57086.1 hypothetical protein [Mycolicibacterium sp. CBMA 335]MUL70126.1 hypothetical protein [Mycolicibacterium sp. CBMA 311]MUL92174.1 hypothetical protein [Mycolicibacterium sp. CBMA 230]MUM05914.1 hypothetical protein [Mycolicibacterium sp. CBMA 213]
MNRISRFTTTLLVASGLGFGVLAAGTANADTSYTFGPFQWCPGQPFPGDLVFADGGICHTYYYSQAYGDGGAVGGAHYWEGENKFPTPIPPPPPPANAPNIFEQCPGLIPFVNCLPGL